MPKEPQRPQRPSWRSAGQQPAPRPKHAWQGGPVKKELPEPEGVSRRTKLAIVGSSLSILAAVVVILLLWIRTPKPSRLELIVATHSQELTSPITAHGEEARRAVQQLVNDKFSAESHDLGVDDEPWKALNDRVTGSLLRSKPAEKVLLFLAVPGGADEQGPYLIPDGPNSPDPSRFLRFNALLEQLRLLPEETKKLVILDAVQAPAFWPLGIVRNDFARRLKEQDENIKAIKNLVIFCSADEGQRSWVAEEWGQSVFAHYILAGLQGSQNISINGQELFDQVSRQVREWVYGNRAAYQEPIMLGDRSVAKRMEFIGQGSDESTSATEPHKLDGLQEIWAKRDDLAKNFPPPWATAPQLWRQYLDSLIRYETLVRIGADTKAARDNLNALSGKLADAGRETLTSIRATLPSSVALAVRASGAPDASLEKSLMRAWDSFEKDRDTALKEVRVIAGNNVSGRWSRILGLLLQLAIVNPEKNLARACDMARTLCDDANQPPAEILLMLELQSFHQ